MEVNAQPLKIGAVIFPGFELLDIFGPLEMLGMLREQVSITMLAEKPGEVRSNQGPKGVADAALADVSALDVLLVPGGWGTRTEVQNAPFLDLLRARAKEARFVASICTGSALLAKTGVLDGKRATSNKLAFDWVTSQGPNVIWIREARWVEDGNIYTSSGVSAGMDMTLGLIQRLFDRSMSLQIARWAEYSWHEDKTVDPFALPAP
jgi:transcriptional regulator GlxA family with amidase domain